MVTELYIIVALGDLDILQVGQSHKAVKRLINLTWLREFFLKKEAVILAMPPDVLLQMPIQL